MLKSMTGFGRAEGYSNGYKITIEIRTVNHRYHEVMFKMSKDLLVLEDKLKRLIQKYIKRGRVDLYISLDKEDLTNQKLKVNWELLNQYIDITEQLKGYLDINNNLEIKDLLAIPELINYGQEDLDIDSLSKPLLDTLDIACANLYEMREKEGANLNIDLKNRISTLNEISTKIAEKAPVVVDDYRNRLRKRITEWLDDSIEIDEARFLNEVAFFTDKANIDEELTRLNSHFQQFLTYLEEKEPVGRKLDFLIQEMNREVNTIGSKANDLQISQLVVEMKSELEKMREQVQNVE